MGKFRVLYCKVKLKECLRLFFVALMMKMALGSKKSTKVYSYSISKGRLLKGPSCPRMAEIIISY